jgi:cell division protein FtsA
MQKKQVAIIDVGSSKITALVGERGINKTFVIKGRFDFNYDGFIDGEFLNVEELRKTLFDAVSSIRSAFTKNLKTIYLGVPAEFTDVLVKERQISFAGKKKITEEDLDNLYDSAFIVAPTKSELINRSAVNFELDDFRKLANPIGCKSALLKGKLSFVYCKEYFINNVKSVVEKTGAYNVECVSTSLCEAIYLLEPQVRDRIAMILDVGYISTSFTIVQGDGIIYEKSIPFGGGIITGALTDKLETSFSVAEDIKRKVNLSSKTSSGSYDIVMGEEGKYYSLETVKNTVLNSLDTFCEQITIALEESGFILPEHVPLFVTGGGIAFLRGAKERLSNRLAMPISVLTPKVPLMENPLESSVLSILDLALEQI